MSINEFIKVNIWGELSINFSLYCTTTKPISFWFCAPSPQHWERIACPLLAERKKMSWL